MTNTELVAQLIDAVEANDKWLTKAGELVERLNMLEHHLENTLNNCFAFKTGEFVDWKAIREADKYLNQIKGDTQ